jgi:hypothetical protein
LYGDLLQDAVPELPGERQGCRKVAAELVVQKNGNPVWHESPPFDQEKSTISGVV